MHNVSLRLIKRIFAKLIRQLFKGYLYCIYFFCGPSYILLRMDQYVHWVGYVFVLRLLGAIVGTDTRIEPGLRIQNSCNGRCHNLQVGEHVYIGPECLFDLACSITIENDVALSARSCLITHADVGGRPLKHRFGRKEGSITIKAGSWLGVNSTVLHGVTIGKYAVIGAMSLIKQDIPSNTLSFGIPCKVIKCFEGPLGRSEQERAET